MSLILNITSTKLDNEDPLENEDLQELTRELCKSIAKETDIKAEIPRGESVEGARGDLSTWGEIVLTFLSNDSASAVALFAIFKSYFDRNSSLTIKIKRKDGTSLEITSKNNKLEKIQTLLSHLDSLEHL